MERKFRRLTNDQVQHDRANECRDELLARLAERRISSSHGGAEGLAPCPFCGGKAETEDEKVFCGNCGAYPSQHEDIEANRAFWNTRATVPAESACEALQSISLEAGLILVQWADIPEDLRNAISHLKTLASEAQLGKLSVLVNGAAGICAEMAREMAQQVEKHERLSASLDEKLLAARYHGMADALREAERRIGSPTVKEERRAIARWVKGLVNAGIMFTQTVKVSDKQTQLQPVSADYIIDLAAASSATGAYSPTDEKED